MVIFSVGRIQAAQQGCGETDRGNRQICRLKDQLAKLGDNNKKARSQDRASRRSLMELKSSGSHAARRPLLAPAQETEGAEAAGEEREGGGERRGGNTLVGKAY
jgi:hypothetical protein